MKLLVIGHNFVVKENQRILQELKLQSSDIQITLVSPYWWMENTRKTHQEIQPDSPYPVHRVRTLFTGDNSFHVYSLRLMKIIRQVSPDHIEVWEEPWSLSLLQVVLIKKFLRLKASITCYSAQNIYKHFPFPFNHIERFNFKNVSGIHVCSEGVRDVLGKKGYSGIVRTIGLGIDLATFKYKEPKRRTPFALGYVGRLTRAKGVYDLIDAMRHLPECELHIAGGGPDELSIKRQIEAYHLTDRVEFHGSLDIHSLVDFYHRINLLLVPSHTTSRWKEQFGRIIVEALSCGTPVAGSNSGSIPEILGDNGMVFQEGNVETIVTAIRAVINKWPLWKAKSEKARNNMQERFSWPVIAREFRSMLESIQ